MKQIWRWYVDLSETRHYLPNGSKNLALRIDRAELFFFAETRDLQFEPWQVAAIELVDDMFVRAANGDRQQVSSGTLTPDLVNAMFNRK